MKIQTFLQALFNFWRLAKRAVDNRRAEGNLETVSTILKYHLCPALIVIDGIKYIVESHFKQEGKNVSESVYRLMERELHESA